MTDPLLDDTGANIPVFTHVTDGRNAWVGLEAEPGRYKVTVSVDGVITLTPDPAGGDPYRFVDNAQRGWITFAPGQCSTFPAIDGRSQFTHEEVYAQWGPVRPVTVVSDLERNRLCALLAATKSKAVGTLINALHTLYHECVDADGHPYRMAAGHPGADGSKLLLELASKCDLQPPPAGFDQASGVKVHEILHRWVFATDRFVEVAGTLSEVFGDVVDGRGGWDQVADRWLYKHPLAPAVQNLLRIKSVHYTGR